MNIIQAIDHDQLFKPHFGAESWDVWKVILKAAFALEMTASEREVFYEIAERKPPKEMVDELWVVAGVRGGKSRCIALIACFFAVFKDYRQFLSVGEVPRILVMAAGKHQARTVFKYIEGFLTEIPVLKQKVEKVGQQQIRLTNGLVIEVITNNYRALQSYTSPVVICDEIAYWEDETSANPGNEVIRAARPRMATLPKGYRMLLAISSPFRRDGVLWDEYCEHYGKDDDPVLVVHAPTWKLNPTLPDGFIERQYKKDPYMASRYYGAEFRSDIEGAFDEMWIQQCINRNRPMTLAPQDVKYYAFVDASGGKGDAMTLAIGHVDGHIVIDVITGRQGRFNPRAVADEFCNWLRQYKVGKVHGDRYAGNWVQDAFAAHGIQFEPIKQNKSEIYHGAGPVFAQADVEIPEHEQLIRELNLLERRSTRMGNEIIDHPRHEHDDFANAVCGVIVLAHKTRRQVDLRQAHFGAPREMVNA